MHMHTLTHALTMLPLSRLINGGSGRCGRRRGETPVERMSYDSGVRGAGERAGRESVVVTVGQLLSGSRSDSALRVHSGP